MKNLILFLAVSAFFTSTLSFGSVKSKEKSDEDLNCKSARELITTLEFLKSVPALSGNDKNSIQIARRVASGCSGSALRFINTVNLLTKAEIDNNGAIEAAIDVANGTDEQSDAFFDVFQKSYLSEYLDLSAYQSLGHAKKLSVEYKGDSDRAREDFEKIVKYCLKEEGLNFPRQKCAEISIKFASMGENYDGHSVYEPFVEMYEFLKKDGGAQFSKVNTLSVMERVLMNGYMSGENFISSYEYAKSDKGLKLGAKDALVLAEDIAIKSRKKSELP